MVVLAMVGLALAAPRPQEATPQTVPQQPGEKYSRRSVREKFLSKSFYYRLHDIGTDQFITDFNTGINNHVQTIIGQSFLQSLSFLNPQQQG